MRRIDLLIKIGIGLAIIALATPIPSYPVELKSVDAELESTKVIISTKDNICLLSVFKMFNPNDRPISATLDYTLRIENEILGRGQLPTVYVPSGKTVEQREAVVTEYKSWFAKLYFQGSNPGEALKILLPLWKGLGGEEPGGLPGGMWSNISVNKPELQVDGSITVVDEDGTEKIFFFRSSLKDLE